MQTQYCHQYLTLQTARPDVWLGLLHTPAHPFSSTTQLCSGTVPDTPYMSRSYQRYTKQTLPVIKPSLLLRTSVPENIGDD
ncbi:hypothetical protein PoB_004012000 [Plakobranchus ocellatus]|uniref:Uncharacterized protein n=1 Tax=Plakobranchus ocellatus TaxID=259542 RepID=A0AAV4AZ16_9GAST|nr:hypothetical protein PoB_004012000 [Plakobranchus ocellatus]